MSTRNKAIILAVKQGSMSTRAAAQQFNVSERWVKELLSRYVREGETAFQPRSKRPKTTPNRTPEPIRERIKELREHLTQQGLDAGPETIATHLANENLNVPAKSTIHRILRTQGLVTENPKKRPKSSYTRFQAEQPNQLWQSDFTHWRLADNTDVEILNFLDDHSRYLLSITAYKRVTGRNVVTQFENTTHEHGRPQSMLTDNGLVYTTRLTNFTRGIEPAKNLFEKTLQKWDIKQINGKPGHPQTQGKIERFHRTLKQWLTRQKPAHTIAELNTQLTQFQTIYNTLRPHKGAGRKPPIHAYQARPKATPQPLPQNEYRVRTDKVDKFGKLTIRYDGKLRHLGMGVAYRGHKIRMLIDNADITVIDTKTGEILKQFEIDPNKNYQKQKPSTHQAPS